MKNIRLYRSFAIVRKTGIKKFFCGKVIGKILYREFGFSRAVLWQTHEVSIDKKAVDDVKDLIRSIRFTDITRKESYSISTMKFMKLCREAHYGEGTQYYVAISALRPVKFKKMGYVKYEYVIE